MTTLQQLLIIAVVALATMATRFVPFLVFKSGRPTPKFLKYLGRVLPPAVFGMLVVYCFKGVDILGGSHGIPELIAVAAVVILHLIFRKMLLSIAGGTVAYMILINLVFA